MSSRTKWDRAHDPRATKEQLLKLAQSDSEYAIIVARHPKADAAMLDTIFALTKGTDYEDMAHAAVLVNGRASKALVQNVAKSVEDKLDREYDYDYPQERHVAVPLARHVHAPKAIVRKLARSWYLVREQIAARSDLPMDLLKYLSQDWNANVRRAVANNSKVTAGLLMSMTHDSDETVRFAIARNKAATKRVLMMMADDESEAVRLAVGCSAEFERRDGRVESLSKDINATAATVVK